MRIILAGIIGRYPYGGVGWCSLMYLSGLRALGHEVWYLEDTGECGFDPLQDSIVEDPAYAVTTVRHTLAPHGFGDHWCYIDHTGAYHGHTREAWLAVCRDADLFLNLSGGCWFWRDEYRAIPRRGFIDSDPAFTQLSLAEGVPWYVDFFKQFDALFTFGQSIGTAGCDVPTCGHRWRPTYQPVDLDAWPRIDAKPTTGFSTIMSWRISSFKGIGGNKDLEITRILDLPKRTDARLEIALGGTDEARRFLSDHGWHCRNALDVSLGLDAYRAFIQNSRAELSIAKHTYVRTRCGWFSDRTECYLASGRPAVVQDTGFSRHLPTGEGLIAFEDGDQALAGVEAIRAEYAKHSRSARQIAAAHFDARVVLPPLLDAVTSGSGASS